MTIVIPGIGKSVDWRRHRVVELEQGARPLERHRVEQSRIALELGACLRSKRAKKVRPVYAREPTFDESRTALEIERYRHGGRPPDFGGQVVTMLAKPLEKHVASERKASQREWLAWALIDQAPHDCIEIGRLSGMVEPTRPGRLTVARPEYQCVGRPPTVVCEREQSTQIMRSDGSLQPVEHEKTAVMRSNTTTGLEAMQLDLVTIIHRPPLDTRVERWRATHELSPEGSQVCARYPPCGGIGILAGAAHVMGTGSKLGTDGRSIIPGLRAWMFRSLE